MSRIETIDDFISKHNLPVSSKITKSSIISDERLSKMILDEREVRLETVPNAVVLGGLPEIGLERIKPATIPKLLLTHPAIERGIEFKFNRMITQLDKNDIGNNVISKNNSDKAIDAKNYCTEILKNSHNQPVSFIKQFGRDAMRFGDNYLFLVSNKARNKILRWELQHPVFFSPMYDIKGVGTTKTSSASDFAFRGQDNLKYRIDPKTKKPKEYTQLKKVGDSHTLPTAVNDPEHIIFVPTGKPIPSSRVVQLNFDRMGDEPYGIPIAQTLWVTVKHIIRVEDAGTETMIAFGYNRWVASTQFRTEEKMKAFAKSIENIKKRSVTVLPEGIKLDNIKPGSTEFDKVHDILLTLIAMRLGISIVQLKGSGADINKATLGKLMDDMRFDFFADELELESAINDGFIKSCIITYNLKTKKQLNDFPFPRFNFSEMAEDKDQEATRLLKQSLSLRNFSYSIDLLMANGFKDQATKILDNYITTLIPQQETQEDFSKKEKDNK